LATRACQVAGLQTQQRLFLKQLNARLVDAGFFVSSCGALVKLSGAGQLAALAIKIAVGFEGLTLLADKIENLTTFQRQIQMPFAFFHLAAVQVAPRYVQVRPSLLRNGCFAAVRA
jgi:hypothetical protein